MDQPLPLPWIPGPDAGLESSAGAADLAATVTALVGDPRAWFARSLIDTGDLDAPAGRALATQIEDIVDQVFAPEPGAADPAATDSTVAADSSDPAGSSEDAPAAGRLSREDMVAFVQATSREMARMEALRAWAVTMLTRDAAYHECDTDDGTGRACPSCTSDDPAADEAWPPTTSLTTSPKTSVNASPVGQVGFEVSAALGMSPTFATTLVDDAVDQICELPTTWATMTGGGIDGYKARLIAAGTRTLIQNIDLAPSDPAYPVEVARRERLRRDIETRVLPDAGAKTGEQLRRQIRRLVLRADPDTMRAARTTGTADRRVTPPHTRGDDPAALAGIGAMTLHGPIEDLHALHQAIDAAARHTRTTGDPRTLDQLRFDTLTSLAWHALRTGHLGYPECGTTHDGVGTDAGTGADPRADTETGTGAGAGAGVGGWRLAATAGRRPVEIRVTVSLATLLGLNEDPADLDGVGPIPADVAMDLAFGDDATWRRLVTDPLTGALLDHGHRTYRPPAAMDSYIRTRDRTCRFPTTLVAADHADVDHTTPFDHTDTHSCPGRSCRRPGGATAPDNLGVLSRRAHNARTRHHWYLEQPEAGTFRWTSPAGHVYTVDPDPLTEPEPITTPETLATTANDDPPPF